MTWHFIWLAATIICIALMFFSFGVGWERKGIKKDIRGITDDKTLNLIDLRGKASFWTGAWGACIYALFMFILWFGFSYVDLRQKWIDDFRNGDIVENVKYDYQTINGEKVLRDSTITYSRYKKE